MQTSLQRLARAIVGLIVFLVVAPFVIQWIAGPAELAPWERAPSLRHWQPTPLGADASIGLLVLALVVLWASQPRGTAPGAIPWRARKVDPNPGSVNPIADLLDQRREVGTLPPDGMDAEVGGDHVERWRPEDVGEG